MATEAQLVRAAKRILRPHVAIMRSYAALNPMPRPPATRAWPSANFVWRRFISSMITAMTRSTPEVWDGLHADPVWQHLRREGPDGCLPTAQLARFLARHRIRFPRQKAERIRRALRCDFDGLAREMRRTFGEVHDARRDRSRRRQAEVHLAEMLQAEFAGCGVAPKIARLALLGAPEVTQVIPIDSRWMNALRDAGFELTPPQLANERRYRVFEDALCEAAYALGVRPTDADGIPFGWLLNEGV